MDHIDVQILERRASFELDLIVYGATARYCRCNASPGCQDPSLELARRIITFGRLHWLPRCPSVPALGGFTMTWELCRQGTVVVLLKRRTMMGTFSLCDCKLGAGYITVDI